MKKVMLKLANKNQGNNFNQSNSLIPKSILQTSKNNQDLNKIHKFTKMAMVTKNNMLHLTKILRIKNKKKYGNNSKNKHVPKYQT